MPDPNVGATAIDGDGTKGRIIDVQYRHEKYQPVREDIFVLWLPQLGELDGEGSEQSPT